MNESAVERAERAEEALVSQLRQQGLHKLWGEARKLVGVEAFTRSSVGKAWVAKMVAIVADAQQAYITYGPEDIDVRKMHARAAAAHLALEMLDEVARDSGDALKALDTLADDFPAEESPEPYE